MKAESFFRIDAFLSSSAVELFASHGVSVHEVEFRHQGIDEPFASTIGFTAERILGVLVLTASRELAEASLPENLRAPRVADEIVADWAGELSNQFLGRLKNRFYAAGVEIALSTPTVFAGKELRHFAHPSPLYRSLFFEGPGSLLVEFQADYGEDFELGEAGSEPVEAPPEGEALFF